MTQHTLTLPNTSALFEGAKAMKPRLAYENYKGQAGRIAVVGGCLEYTGAPYFAAMTALRAGADLSHVFCETQAGIPIKCYSPELIVHPVIEHMEASLEVEVDVEERAGLDLDHDRRRACVDAAVSKGLARVLPWFNRLSCMVFGPGLGQDEIMVKTAKRVISKAVSEQMPIVLDGDAIRIVCDDPSIIHGYSWCILTPNLIEFKRLCKAVLGVDVPLGKHSPWSGSVVGGDDRGDGDDRDGSELVIQLANALGGVTVLRKQHNDVISNGSDTLHCDFPVSMGVEKAPRRCGGQGDVLAGAIAVFLSWAHERDLHRHKEMSQPTGTDATDPVLLAAWAGVMLTGMCACEAYKDKERSMVATDLIDHIQSVSKAWFGP